MAIFGLGAFYDEDVTNKFLLNDVACIGWSHKDAPSLHKLMVHIKVGDIIYIKSYPLVQGLEIKAVGIVLDDNVFSVKGVGEACLKVKWIWEGSEIIDNIENIYNVRRNTIYEEFNADVQKKVIDLLTSKCV